ncbi:apolipoprotein N-acyltransferase [Candidatus Pelagibacter sp. Uisw_137]|uniref:apolipoprotein N-acyltransferase n=1 Tax=Candidatus Pelagibacter sp. Uisw_137 TaxID=3230992 RepID=UPI0039EBC543
MLKKKFLNILYIFFLGAISSYSLPPYNYFIINFFTFSLFFIFLFTEKKTNPNNKSFFKYGWFFGFGYFLFSLYWIAISLTFDESFKFLIPIAIVLFPAFLAIFYGLITYLFSVFYSKNVVSTFFIFSILYGSIEFIRGSILTGFSWNLIAFSFSESIYFIQILSVIGTYSFNLICISLFTVPAIFILRKTRKEIIVCFFFIIISVGFLFFGNLKYNQFNTTTDIKNNFTIRAVSPNISLERFYSKQDELKIIQELISLSSPEKKQPTIFLWPEGIIPDSYLRDMYIYKELFSNNFGNDDLIIMGLNSVKTKNSENLFFNSMAVFNNKLDLIHSYNKINLVPFGEFIPFETVLSLIGLKTVTNDYQSFSKGENQKALSIKNDKIELKLLPLICYEIIYSNRLFKDKNFDYIINISEDGWFGNSIGPKQHFAHSIFRSIESGKYIIRSANNGISAIINPIGIIEKKIEFGTIGYVDFKESKVIKSTFYMNYGDKIFFILILLYIFLLFSFKKIAHE